jgi:hypothetical protein
MTNDIHINNSNSPSEGGWNSVSVTRRPIPTSASLWRGQDIPYSRPIYALFHRERKTGTNDVL